MLVLLLAAAATAGFAGSFGIRSAAATAGHFCGCALGQELLPAMLAAKVKRLALALGAQGRRFVHRHAADWVGLHKDVRYSLPKRSSAPFTPANADPEILLHRNLPT